MTPIQSPRLKYFIQCDEVRHDGGKFSAIGIFDTIFAFVFPAVHRRFFLLLGFHGPAGQYDVELEFTDPTGRVAAKVSGQLGIPADGQTSNVVFNLEHFPLPCEGVYKITVFLDGDFLAEQEFRVQPPVPPRERTPEEIAILLTQPDIVKSANADVRCDRCQAVYRFQHLLDPNARPEAGFLPLPPGDIFKCAVCGRSLNLSQVRQSLSNIVGIPRQWLESREPETDHGGGSPPPA
ncbi:MAG: hypothetical protein N2111_09670 [Candidatus Sumerlaeaceae bacterium]|nr:hypothetical protein [Candidatus Sumerlaeaceae bacterium]